MAAQRELVRWYRLTRGPLTRRESSDVGKEVKHPEVSRVRSELRALGIDVPLRIVWSGDGSGVEEDAPLVIHLMRSLARADAAPRSVLEASDRIMALGVAGVARHEVGHSLLFAAPAEGRRREFVRLFGDVRVAYRVGNPFDEVIRRVRRHGGLSNPRYRRVVSLYAATHPHERFAEAVRVVLACRGRSTSLRAWTERHRTAAIVLAQLEYAAAWLCGYGRGAG
jgi:hypothetical protein